MTKAEKTALIGELTEKFKDSKFFYLTDYSTLNVADINAFRRLCFENDVEVKAVKNTLIRKALDNISDTAYTELYDSLKGATAVLFSEEGKTPAVVLEKFRKSKEKPTLKAAYIDSSVFVGDDQIKDLAKLKSKSDLIAEVIALLESPMKNVMSQLNSGSNTIFGLLTTLEEREE